MAVVKDSGGVTGAGQPVVSTMFRGGELSTIIVGVDTWFQDDVRSNRGDDYELSST